MSKIDIYSQYISRQQYLLENSLVGGQKLISEREMLINRLMAEGFTSKQIEHILNEMPNWARSAFGDAFSNQGYESPQKSTKSITRPSAKPVSKSVVPNRRAGVWLNFKVAVSVALRPIAGVLLMEMVSPA